MTTGITRFVCLLLVALSADVALAEDEAKRNAGQPNVVILFTDDQGTLDANCYGSDRSDHAEHRQAGRNRSAFHPGIRAYRLLSGRAALMTGRHPQRGGVHHWTQGDMNGPDGINMAFEEVTLAEALKDAGYRTALFGKWHLGAHRDFGPKKQGFDEFFGIRDGFIDNYNHYFLHRQRFSRSLRRHRSGPRRRKVLSRDDGAAIAKFMEENKDRPFFLYVPFNIPHYPEQALSRVRETATRTSRIPARRSYAAMVSDHGSLHRAGHRQAGSARAARKHDRDLHERQRPLRRNQIHDPSR